MEHWVVCLCKSTYNFVYKKKIFYKFIIKLTLNDYIMKVKQFENYLVKSNLARNTIMAYLLSVKNFMKDYKTINHKNLIEYKSYLIDNYKYQTVNLRLQGLNKYLDFYRKT